MPNKNYLISNLLPTKMLRKNFFAILSTVKGREFESRELEFLPMKTADWYRANNGVPHPNFVYNLLVSRFIHLINCKPGYKNRGRLDLNPELPLQYSEPTIKAILQLYFNREDAESSVLFLTGHGSPKGEFMLWTKEGEFPLNFQTISDLWNNRTSKARNKELLIIADFCFSGAWVSANQQPDIFVQSSCANKEKARDIKVGDQVVGSVFLHNLLMLNGAADCFFEGVNQTPTCSFLKGDQMNRVRDVFELNIMKRNWDDFKYDFKDKVRSFSKDSIIWEGPLPMTVGPPPGQRTLPLEPINDALSRSGMRQSGSLAMADNALRQSGSISLSGATVTTTIEGPGGVRFENEKKSFQSGGGGGGTSSTGGSFMFKFGNR